MRPRHAHDPVSQALDDAFEVHGDHRLILDDEHVGRDLGSDLAAGLVDQFFHLSLVETENGGDVSDREAFDRAQEEGLARQRRNRFKLVVRGRWGTRLDIGLEIDADRVPQTGEGPEQGNPRIDLRIEQRGVLDQHFKRGGDIGVAGSLVARKRAGKPPQVRKMRRNGL